MAISLRLTLLAILGPRENLSVKEAINELGLQGSVTLRELARQEEAKFTIMPMGDLFGIGPILAERVRVYFFVSTTPAFQDVLDLADTFSDLVAFLPQIFNGRGSAVDGIDDPALATNDVEVFYNSSEFNGQETVNIVSQFSAYTADRPPPNTVHMDWAGFVERSATTTTLEMLKRNFAAQIGEDDGALGPIIGGSTDHAFIGGVHVPVSDWNRYNEYAGRRSFAIGKESTVVKVFNIPVTVTIYYLETGFVGKLSRPAHAATSPQLTNVERGKIVSIMTERNVNAWSIMFRNAVKFIEKQSFPLLLDVLSNDSSFNLDSANENLTPVPFGGRRGNTLFDQGEFFDSANFVNSPWIRQMLQGHPGL